MLLGVDDLGGRSGDPHLQVGVEGAHGVHEVLRRLGRRVAVRADVGREVDDGDLGRVAGVLHGVLDAGQGGGTVEEVGHRRVVDRALDEDGDGRDAEVGEAGGGGVGGEARLGVDGQRADLRAAERERAERCGEREQERRRAERDEHGVALRGAREPAERAGAAAAGPRVGPGAGTRRGDRAVPRGDERGTSVSPAAVATSTTIAPPTAMPESRESPSRRSPASEMATARPEASTARPAVARVRPTSSSSGGPGTRRAPRGSARARAGVVDREAEAEQRHDVHGELVDGHHAEQPAEHEQRDRDRGERGEQRHQAGPQAAEDDDEHDEEHRDRDPLADRGVGDRLLDERLLREQRAAHEHLGGVDGVQRVGDAVREGEGLVVGQRGVELDDDERALRVVGDEATAGVGVGELDDAGHRADAVHDLARARDEVRGEVVAAGQHRDDGLALGASSSRRSAARADALPGGAGSTSEVLSKTAPPSTAPATRRTAQTTRTTPRRRAANRPVRCSRRPSVMGLPSSGTRRGVVESASAGSPTTFVRCVRAAARGREHLTRGWERRRTALRPAGTPCRAPDETGRAGAARAAAPPGATRDGRLTPPAPGHRLSRS